MHGLILVCLWGVVDRIEGDLVVVEWAEALHPDEPVVSDVAGDEVWGRPRESDPVSLCLWAPREERAHAIRSFLLSGRRPSSTSLRGDQPDRVSRSSNAPHGASKEGVSCTR